MTGVSIGQTGRMKTRASAINSCIFLLIQTFLGYFLNCNNIPPPSYYLTTYIYTSSHVPVSPNAQCQWQILSCVRAYNCLVS